MPLLPFQNFITFKEASSEHKDAPKQDNFLQTSPSNSRKFPRTQKNISLTLNTHIHTHKGGSIHNSRLTGKRIMSPSSVLVASTKYSIQKLKIFSSGVASQSSGLFLNRLMSIMLPMVDLRYLKDPEGKNTITRKVLLPLDQEQQFYPYLP